MMRFPLSSLASLCLIVSTALAAPAQAPPGYTLGKVWTGPMAKEESVGAIMQRERLLRNLPRQKPFYKREFEGGWEHVPQDPRAPVVSKWPMSQFVPQLAPTRSPLAVKTSFLGSSFVGDSLSEAPPDTQGAPGLTTFFLTI